MVFIELKDAPLWMNNAMNFAYNFSRGFYHGVMDELLFKTFDQKLEDFQCEVDDSVFDLDMQERVGELMQSGQCKEMLKVLNDSPSDVSGPICINLLKEVLLYNCKGISQYLLEANPIYYM